MSKNAQNNREKGNKGEDIACLYLKNHGYFVQERNYLKKWGEIDIIAVKNNFLHFIEVKSVQGSSSHHGHKPEENVHNLKVRKLRRVIQTYLNERKYGPDAVFKFHIITVEVGNSVEDSRVEMIEDVIL